MPGQGQLFPRPAPAPPPHPVRGGEGSVPERMWRVPGNCGGSKQGGGHGPPRPQPLQALLLLAAVQEQPGRALGVEETPAGAAPRPPAVWPASARVSAGTPHPLVLSSPSAPGPPWPPGCIPPAQAPRLQPTLAFGGLHPRPTHGRAPEAAPGSWAWGQSPGSGAAVPMCTRQLSHQKQPRSGPPHSPSVFLENRASAPQLAGLGPPC